MQFPIIGKLIATQDGISFCERLTPIRGSRALLNIAIADGSANKVIAIFKGFMQGDQGGGAQPSSARGHGASGKPIYTRETIGQLYEAHRKGAYTGREQEWARQEADIFAAQREGRVHDVAYLTK